MPDTVTGEDIVLTFTLSLLGDTSMRTRGFNDYDDTSTTSMHGRVD